MQCSAVHPDQPDKNQCSNVPDDDSTAHSERQRQVAALTFLDTVGETTHLCQLRINQEMAIMLTM